MGGKVHSKLLLISDGSLLTLLPNQGKFALATHSSVENGCVGRVESDSTPAGE